MFKMAMSESEIGFVGVIIGAFIARADVFITPIIEWWKETQSTKKKAHYLAIRIVCILDQFVTQCANATEGEFVDDDGQGQSYCKYGPIPDISSFPDDIDWKTIDETLRYEILSLPNKIDLAKQHIGGISGFDSPPYDDTNEKMKYALCSLGVIACDIASKLRKNYKLPYEDEILWSNGWEPCLHLSEKKKDIEKLLKKRGEIPPEWGCSVQSRKKQNRRVKRSFYFLKRMLKKALRCLGVQKQPKNL